MKFKRLFRVTVSLLGVFALCTSVNVQAQSSALTPEDLVLHDLSAEATMGDAIGMRYSISVSPAEPSILADLQAWGNPSFDSYEVSDEQVIEVVTFEAMTNESLTDLVLDYLGGQQTSRLVALGPLVTMANGEQVMNPHHPSNATANDAAAAELDMFIIDENGHRMINTAYPFTDDDFINNPNLVEAFSKAGLDTDQRFDADGNVIIETPRSANVDGTVGE